MILPLDPSPKIKTSFVVCDIENRTNGDVLAIDTYDGSGHVTWSNWGEWLEWVGNRAKKDKQYRTIYAHNGGEWDWLSFIEWVLKYNESTVFSTIENGNKVIALVVPLPNGVTLRLVDSLYLLKTSLDKAGKKYVGKGKIETNHLPEWYWDNDRAKFMEYLYRDTELLFDTLVAFMKLIYNKIAPIKKCGLTLPSTSLRCFQTSYLDREVSTPTNADVKALLREGYTGGRVEVFRAGEYPNIYVYDVNSLYPSVMATIPVPTTGNANFTTDLHWDQPGVYRIRFEQRDRTKLPVLMVRGVGEYKGEGVYFINEIRRLLVKADGKISIIEGCVFSESGVLFRKYIETLYALRMTDKNGPLGDTCKLLMNSLYGKFGQLPERTTTMVLTPGQVKQLLREGVDVETIKAEWDLYRITEEHQTPFEHVGIAGTITSEARARLWEGFNSGTVYCDTDSVHTTEPLPPEIVGGELGQFKIEFEGRAVYCGKKLYALKDGKKVKIRAKGIRIGGDFGFDLTYNGLRSLLSGTKIECKFRSPTTANAVMKGKTACVFSLRKRTIRKTARE